MKTTEEKPLLETLADMSACSSALQWVRENRHASLQSAWDACERGDWMLWFAGRRSGAPQSDGRKKLVLAACECARLALPYAKSPAVLTCIETAEKWTRGEATIEQVREARRSAYAALAALAALTAALAAALAALTAALAAALAARAAALAAYTDAAEATATAADAADAAAADAADAADAARKRVLKKCADIVRKHYPVAP